MDQKLSETIERIVLNAFSESMENNNPGQQSQVQSSGVEEPSGASASSSSSKGKPAADQGRAAEAQERSPAQGLAAQADPWQAPQGDPWSRGLSVSYEEGRAQGVDIKAPFEPPKLTEKVKSFFQQFSPRQASESVSDAWKRWREIREPGMGDSPFLPGTTGAQQASSSGWVVGFQRSS